jgi:5-methylcytosine-specific restriction protein A
MNRKQFIESQGATCNNWNWSWSFVNESQRLIIFGAWDVNTNGRTAQIFTEEWKINRHSRKNPGYDQSREHVRLVEEEGYRLMTFPMKYSEDKDGLVKIVGFTPELTEKKITNIGNSWYAIDSNSANPLPLAEELPTPSKYSEGAKCSVTINAYERNPKARAACIAHHGLTCSVCGFNFAAVYGNLGEGFIHVHHITPIGEIGKEYEINPKTDLIPVCPNCHAMIHRTEPALTVEQLREHLGRVNKPV